MQKVLRMAIMQPLQQLLHKARYLIIIQLEQTRVEQAEQIVIHVLEHQIELASILPKIERVVLIRNDLDHIDYIRMLELTQYLNLSHSRDRKPFLLVLELNALERHQLLGLCVARFKHLPVRALANHLEPLEHVHAPLAPVLPLQLASPLQYHRPFLAAHVVDELHALAVLHEHVRVVVQMLFELFLVRVHVVGGLFRRRSLIVFDYVQFVLVDVGQRQRW